MTPHEWGQRYAETEQYLQSLAGRTHNLIVDLLNNDGIDVIQVESRAKSVESFIGKLQRKGQHYADPLVDMTDLVGVRIITYYTEDVDRVAHLIDREFEVDDHHSASDLGTDEPPDQFGYRSRHYVVRLSADRCRLQEWQTFRTQMIEIQVRTALQHAWAAVSHKLDYKAANEAPSKLRRRLFRLSALFELADEQFSELRKLWEITEEGYRSQVKVGHLDVAIDSVYLTAYMNEAPRVAQLQKLMHDAGLPIRRDAERSRVDVDRRDLLATLREFGIATLLELDYVIASTPIMRCLIDAYLKAGLPTPAYSLEDVLTQLLMIRQPVAPGFALKIYYDHQWPLIENAIEIFNSTEPGRDLHEVRSGGG